MKLNVKKLLVMLLCIVLCLAMSVSCFPVKNTETSDTTGTTNDGEEPGDEPSDDPEVPRVSPEELDIIKNGISDYRIVYSITATEWEKEMAANLQSAIKRITGVMIPRIDDVEYDEETVRQEKEILIGRTNREDDYETLDATDIGYGYLMYVSYERFVICGNSQAAMYQALREFILDYFDYDLDSYDKDVTKLPSNHLGGYNLTVPSDYTKQGEIESVYFPEWGVMLEDLCIKYDGSNFEKRVALKIRDSIKSATGKVLEVTDQPQAIGTPVIVFEPTRALEKGSYKISVSDSELVVSANGYYGFFEAAKYFKNAIEDTGYYPFSATVSVEDDYLESATGVYESTKYAYDKQGEHRVMFYNVLFGDKASSGSGTNKVIYDVPPAPRNELQQLMIAEYMPDVLGCQEFNKTKRGNNSTGDGGLVELLAELGYAEAVDPRVKNAYAANQKIPNTDASLTTNYDGLRYGYGTSGATKVTVGGETYYTFFNNAPLFYNTKTTKLIKAEYYWYKNQWDERKNDDGSWVAGKEHENSAMDCGSKAATWGVFESLETGDRYIVISTHMCTRSDYVRELQGAEIVALVKQLVAEYECPVFFGGDLNGNIGDSNYDMFVADGTYTSKYLNKTYEGGGYKSLQDHGVATDYTSKLITAHGYPDKDDDTGLMTPGVNNESKLRDVVQQTNKNSIDQILVTNHQTVEVSTFGVVVDDMTLSASDHLPIFADFTIRKAP